MKIYLDDIIEDGKNKGQLFLESDSMQFMLNLYNGKFDGNERELFVNKGYFSSIENALNKVLKIKIQTSAAKTIKELLEEVREFKKYLRQQIEI